MEGELDGNDEAGSKLALLVEPSSKDNGATDKIV
jgi:hypothetical protein